jgi:hypothetical protein
MNPLSMETIFIILSGAILVAGVLYWLWSHIQLTQKKVQLLENAVFELRSMLAARGTEPPAPAVMLGGASPIVESKPVSEYKDLEDDDWQEPAQELPLVSTPLDMDDGMAQPPAIVMEEKMRGDDHALMPGGSSMAGIAPEDAAPHTLREITLGDVGMAGAHVDDERFRSFFKQADGADAPAAVVTSRTPESLESMPVKELRRLAEQRGITGAADMRKKEILVALRQQITSAPAAVAGAEVTVEKGNDGNGDDLGTTEAEILE